MYTLNLTDDLATELLDLADSWGIELDGSDDCRIVETITRCICILNEGDPSPVTVDQLDSVTSETIHSLVESITDYNAGGSVVITPQDDPAAELGQKLVYAELQAALPNDRLVKLASTMSTLDQEALCNLYMNLPNDLWGGIQAERLWKRQCGFMQTGE